MLGGKGRIKNFEAIWKVKNIPKKEKNWKLSNRFWRLLQNVLVTNICTVNHIHIPYKCYFIKTSPSKKTKFKIVPTTITLTIPWSGLRRRQKWMQKDRVVQFKPAPSSTLSVTEISHYNDKNSLSIVSTAVRPPRERRRHLLAAPPTFV